MSDHCDEALAHLYTYLDGELDSQVIADRVRTHLVDCPPCGKAFTFEERLRVVVRTKLHEEVPIEIIERLQMVIRTQINEA
jgi:anti-sigma factor (TIGR02949 family)